MYLGALRSIFSELVRQNRLVSIPSLSLESPKTKLLANRLAELGLSDVLVLTGESDRNLELAGRNLPGVEIRSVRSIDPVCLLAHDKVLATVAALKSIEERLS